MANEKNLIPLNQRSKEDAKKIQSEGGKAAGAARRRKRALKEAADLWLSLPVTDRKRFNRMARDGVDPEDIDNQMLFVIGTFQAAVDGDARSGRLLMDMLGEDSRISDDGVQIIDDIPEVNQGEPDGK